MGFGVGIGCILLLVREIILLMVWAVAVPSLVVERQGMFAAFRRSAELIFGLSLSISRAEAMWSASSSLAGFPASTQEKP